MRDLTYYQRLGVSEDARADQIEAAYDSLARRLRPDQFASGDLAVLIQTERATHELHEAWATLRDPGTRAAYDRLLRAESAGAMPTVRPPDVDECSFCGSTPVAFVHLRQQTGLLLTRRVRSLDAPLCRLCGLAAARAMTSRTIWTGWWGTIAFLFNFVAIGRNLIAMARLRQLAAPAPADADVVAILNAPMSPGRPLLLRSGPATICLILLIGAVAFTSGWENSALSGPWGLVPIVDLQRGDCFDIPRGETVDEVQVVPCAFWHYAEVVGVARHADPLTRPFPGADAVYAEAQRECRNELSAHAGLDDDQSISYLDTFSPTSGSWADGDRSIVCFLETDWPRRGSVWRSFR